MCSSPVEKFETDLSSLQTPPIETESLFLNPRFSISTRFLSRFQSRLRGPGSALRPAPLPPSITEEPSSHSCLDPTPSLNPTQANSKQLVVSSTTESLQEESQIPVIGGKYHPTSLKRRSSSVQQTPQLPRLPLRSRKTIAVLHWRDTLGDVTDKTLRSQSSGPSSSSSTLKPSQPGLDKEPLTRLPRQRYMGTTTSSRAKRSQGEGLNISPTEEHPAGGKIVEARASSLQDLQNITDSECKENLPPSAQPPVVQPPVVQPPVVQPPVVQPPVSHTTTTSLVEPPAPASQPPSVPPSAGNYRARAALHLDLAVPSDPPTLTFPLASHKSQRRFGDSTRHALVTPTEMRSLGKDAKRCLRNMEDSLGPWGGSSGLRSSMAPATSPATAMAPAPATSPAPTTAPAMAPAPATSPAPTTAPAMAPVPATTLEPTTAMALAPTMAPTPRLCPTLPQAQLTESPSHLPLLQQASDSPVSGSACSFPLHGDSGLHGDSVEETLNLQMCHQVANELRHTVRRAVTFYNKVRLQTNGKMYIQ
uniref:Uncharacterized protein n=1 Tax=Hucho hucho TaxID=62062 RepID=A0A4W5RMH0_9TELE